MKLKMDWTGWLYILPTLLLIGIFSLYPVFQTVKYSLFDYHLNEQQKAGLYMDERFNVGLFNETALYLDMFFDDELKNVTDEADTAAISTFLDEMAPLADQFEDKQGVITISTSERKSLESLHQSAESLFQSLDEKYDLTHADDLPLIIEDLDESVVPSNFSGLSGYKQIFHDKRVLIATINTFVFTIISVSLELVLGLGLALILNKAIFGQGFVRTTSLIPWAIPTAVAALMWGYLYDGTSGIVAHYFEILGIIDKSQNLLLTAKGAMASTILADVWKTTPYMALLLLAGLQNIPKGLYEAASIDGASKIKSFFNVTLPLLKTSILVALLFRTLDAFRVFDLIYVLTGGGPGGATETLSVYAYKLMFGQTNFGYGSVVVMLMFICVAIIAIIFVRLLGKDLLDRN